MIQVVGDRWYVWFAMWHETRIVMVRELAIGDTETLIGLYQLVASLKAIAEWIETEYRTWVESAFGRGVEDENDS
jgi:hypothetical protein